jgi:TfoX/Sxy family transcriptional regulator of competence genes
MSRKYVILNTSEIDSVDFTQVLQTSKESLRYTTDGSKFLLKYDGIQPSFLSGETEYTHSEILAILDNVDGDWYITSTE